MISNFKDIQHLFKICRKAGVDEIEIGGAIRIKFGEQPLSSVAAQRADDSETNTDPYAGFPPGELTEEQLMFYSSGGLPENDPGLKGESS